MTKKPTKRAKPRAVRKAVVVLGMHRSGTSALAGVLDRLGCASPASPIPKGEQNPRGFYESKLIARHNDAVLNSAGSTWQDWRAPNPGWIDSPPVRDLAARAVEILEAEFGDAPLIVLKDPRICRLVEYWRLVLDMAGIEPVFIHIHRNPAEVARSLAKRNGFEPSFSMLLWLRYVLEAEAASRGQVRHFTSFERLLQGWAGVITGAQDSLGLSFPRLSEQTGAEIEAFLSRDLRHYADPADQLLSNPMISEWIRTTFEIIERWTRRGAEENIDYAELDRIRTHFNDAAPAFSRFTLVGEQAIENLRSATAGQKAATDRAERLLADLQNAEHELGEARKLRDQLDHQLDHLTSSLHQREAEVDDARREAEAARKDLDAARRETGKLKGDLDARLRELGELGRLLSETEAGHAKAVARLTEAHAAESLKLTSKIQETEANLRKRNAESKENAALARQAWADYEAIASSTSWRITSPLRRLVRVFRGA